MSCTGVSEATEITPLIPEARASPRDGRDAEPAEVQPKSAEQPPSGGPKPSDDGVKYNRNCCNKIIPWFFYVPCFLTGQFVVPTSATKTAETAETGTAETKSSAESRCRGLCFLINWVILILVFLAVNAGSFVFSIVIVAECPFKHCGYIYKAITLESMNSSVITELVAGLALDKYHDWEKTVIITASISAFISYVFMVCVLYSQYGPLKECFKCKKCPSFRERCGDPGHHHRGDRDCDDQELALNPFDDSPIDVNDFKSTSTSTLLTSEQTLYIGFFFILNLLLWATGFVTFFVLYNQKVLHEGRFFRAGTAGLLVQFLSQLCAIFSCFIFSKVAYGVSNRCIDVREIIFPKADDPNPDCINEKFFPGDPLPDNNKHFTLLKKMDQRYVRMVDATLDPYGKWFAIHWVLYTITAFMAISYVAHAIRLELYGTGEASGEKVAKNELRLAYQLFFAVQHLILFLYPCFRAANVTASRSKMIKAVSKKDWKFVTFDQKDSFIQYLKDQDCSFKITILCARFTFGFNTAFVSVFIGILGVLLSVSS